MLLRKRADRKIELHVPCVFCPEPHKFVLSDASVFGMRYVSMRCPASAMSVCHIGAFSDVMRGVRESQRELSELLEEMQDYADPDGLPEDDDYEVFGDDEEDEIDGEPELELVTSGAQGGDGEQGEVRRRIKSFDELLQSDRYTEHKLKIMRDMLLMIEGLAHRERILCRCTDGAGGDLTRVTRAMDRVTVLIDGERIVLTCKQCGEHRTLHAGTSLDCEKLAESEFIWLE